MRILEPWFTKYASLTKNRNITRELATNASPGSHSLTESETGAEIPRNVDFKKPSLRVWCSWRHPTIYCKSSCLRAENVLWMIVTFWRCFMHNWHIVLVHFHKSSSCASEERVLRNHWVCGRQGYDTRMVSCVVSHLLVLNVAHSRFYQLCTECIKTPGRVDFLISLY